MKRYPSMLLAVALLISLAAPAFAAETPAQKEEAVYGLLAPDGSVQSIQVVNSFNGGTRTDYGDYTAVSNMTTSEDLVQNGDQITIDTAADRFYYQGTLGTNALPWHIAIRYRLDGKEIPAAELAGKSGALLITISLWQNKEIHPVFYENYMLQVSLTLDTDKCADIASPNAALASAGKNKIISHTVLPGKGAEVTVEATVRDFSMSGIEIAAMPLSLPIDMPDTGGLTEGMVSLSDATAALAEGAQKLSESIAAAYAGAGALADGSSDFADGISKLGGNSSPLLNASAQIQKALADLSTALDAQNGGAVDAKGLAALSDGLSQLADGAKETAEGARALRDAYAAVHAVLDAAISAIPDADVDPSALYQAAGGNKEWTAALDRLMGYYAAAKAVEGTYAAAQEALASAEDGLDTLFGSVGAMAGALSGMADETEQAIGAADFAAQMSRLRDGLSRLSHQYASFHAGLDEYVNGVKNLAGGYDQVHAGVQSYASGIGELNAGAEGFYQGIRELSGAIAGLPDAIQTEISELTEPYDKSDFVPVSFVSSKNTDVAAVQFVLKTDPIALPQPPEPAAAAPAKLTVWDKLLGLFGL